MSCWYTGSHQITEVKQHEPWSVDEWVTVWCKKPANFILYFSMVLYDGSYATGFFKTSGPQKMVGMLQRSRLVVEPRSAHA